MEREEVITDEDAIRAGQIIEEKKMAEKLGELATMDDIIGHGRDDKGELLPVKVPLKRVDKDEDETVSKYVLMRPATVGVINSVYGGNILTGSTMNKTVDKDILMDKIIPTLAEHMVKPKWTEKEIEKFTLKGFMSMMELFMNWLEVSGLKVDYSKASNMLKGDVSPN